MLGVINALAFFSLLALVTDAEYALAAVLTIGTAAIDYVYLSKRTYPLRYLVPATVFMLVMIVYPIGYTVVVSFTNYGTGHILTMDQAVDQLDNRYFLPNAPETFDFIPLKDANGAISVLLKSAAGQYLLGQSNGTIEPLATGDPRLVDENNDGAPDRVDGYRPMSKLEVVQKIRSFEGLAFHYNEAEIRYRNSKQFALYTKQYTYDTVAHILTDNQTGTQYRPIDGYFTDDKGNTLTPGFRAYVGWDNFLRLLRNKSIAGPFLKVLIWTFEWAGLSVLTTFAVGLLLAVLLNDPRLKLRTLYKTVLIVPYTIPGFISILVWRGLLNPELGTVNRLLNSVAGITVPWLQDAFWAKISLIVVNLWLGFPYMMLVCLGALQSIPLDMYEAAKIDGASGWRQFLNLTLPLLMVSVAPLLVASFAYNFNNFNVIYLLTRGRPPIPGAETPAGATDILISYTYRLAFESGRGADYGLAAAITILIFLFIASISWFNFRSTRALEEVRRDG